MKNDFIGANSKYKEALKYYGYSPAVVQKMSMESMVIYPMPTLKFSRTLMKQASLPRLPVPQLSDTIKRYLDTVEPLLNETEYETTKKVATEFASSSLGQKLQKLLVDKSKTTDNWMHQWWLDKIYLEPRYNLIINANPGQLYPKLNYNTMNGQLHYATKYIQGFLEFKRYLEEQKLPTEKLGEATLCMDQYYKLFGTCRVPRKDKDEFKVMQAYNIDSSRTNHITVMFSNRIYSLQVLDVKTGLELTYEEINANLGHLVRSSSAEASIGLGIMTADNRDVWADVYTKLEQVGQNRQNFEKIQDSLFVLCLDTKNVASGSNSDERSQAFAQN